jgi:hypothetical protein
MKLSSLVIVFLFATSLSPNAFSAPAKQKMNVASSDSKPIKKQSYKEVPYGMAGCGLWSLAIKDKGQGAQIAVSVLENFFYGSQTFAISSGTSNCVEGKSEVAKVEKKVYISSNLNSLSKEAAQGTGFHILALADVFGCPGDEFAQFSQQNFSKLYHSDSPEVVLDSYEAEIRSRPEMFKSCKRAG